MADAEIEQVLREQFLDLMEKTMALRMRPGPADDAYWAMRAWLKAAGWEYYLHCGWDRFYRLANDACDLDEQNWGRRMAMLNSALDGIGHWHA